MNVNVSNNIAAYASAAQQTGAAARQQAQPPAQEQPAAIVSLRPEPRGERAGMSAEEIREALADELERMRAQSEMMQQQMQAAQEQGEAMAESFAKLRKALEIAMRIMSGDNVPPEDKRWLAEHDPELFAKAIKMRIHREDPYDHESLLEDEESADPMEVAFDAARRAVSGAAGAAAPTPTPETSSSSDAPIAM